MTSKKIFKFFMIVFAVGVGILAILMGIGMMAQKKKDDAVVAAVLEQENAGLPRSEGANARREKSTFVNGVYQVNLTLLVPEDEPEKAQLALLGLNYSLLVCHSDLLRVAQAGVPLEFVHHFQNKRGEARQVVIPVSTKICEQSGSTS